jgi:hypothetical protein
MLKPLPLRGVLVTCCSVVTLTVAVLSAQAATTGWRAAASISVKGADTVLSGIDAVTANDAWAAGLAVTPDESKLTSVVEHWAGKSWQRVRLPARVAKAAAKLGFTLSVVAASSSSNVWVVAAEPASSSGPVSYLHFNGKAWVTGGIPGTKTDASQLVQVTAAAAVSSSDVWVFGGKYKISGTQETLVPYAAEFDGRSWSTKSVPGSGEITAASAVSADNIWAVTGKSSALSVSVGTSTPTVLRWTGTRWQAAAPQPAHLPAGADLTAITAERGGDVWIAGAAAASGGGTKAEFVDELTGSSWAPSPTDLKGSASGSSCSPESIVSAGDGGVWTLGLCLGQPSPEFWHRTGSTWSPATSPKFGAASAIVLRLAAVPGTSSVWAVGGIEVHTADDGLIGIDGPTPR